MATENLAIGDVSKQPVCVDKSGKIVPLTGTVGANVADAVQPIYMLNGEIVKIDKNVGASNKPIFMQGGVLKPIAGPIGATNKPVFVNSSGQIVPLSGDAGGSTDKKPLKLVNGALTPVTAELATAADVEKLVGAKMEVVTEFPSEANMKIDVIYVKTKSLVNGTSAVVTLDFDNARMKLNAVSVTGNTADQTKTVTLAAGTYTVFMSGGGGGAGAYGWS